MSDIFELLTADHERHRKMLAKIADTSGDSAERRALFTAFKVEVSAHADAEEQSLYAVMLANPELQDEGRHSVAEHKEIDDFLEELSEMDMAMGGWLTRFKAMRERYEHHIDEEEEDIFPEAKKELSADRAQEMGAKFAARKPAEKAEAKKAEADA